MDPGSCYQFRQGDNLVYNAHKDAFKIDGRNGRQGKHVPADAVFLNGGEIPEILPGVFQGFLGVFKPMKFAVPGPGASPIVEKVVVKQGTPNQFPKVAFQSKGMGNLK